jgi:hypothetical protein
MSLCRAAIFHVIISLWFSSGSIVVQPSQMLLPCHDPISRRSAIALHKRRAKANRFPDIRLSDKSY